MCQGRHMPEAELQTLAHCLFILARHLGALYATLGEWLDVLRCAAICCDVLCCAVLCCVAICFDMRCCSALLSARLLLRFPPHQLRIGMKLVMRTLHLAQISLVSLLAYHRQNRETQKNKTRELLCANSGWLAMLLLDLGMHWQTPHT